METEKLGTDKDAKDKKEKMPLIYEMALPAQSRHCTDFICLVVFIALVSLSIYVMGYGLTYGQPDNLAAGFDSDGNMCGQGTLRPFRYLFFEGLETGNVTQVCVETCPKTNTEHIVCYPNSFVLNCSLVVPYESVQVGSRFCVPTSKETKPKVLAMLEGSGTETYIRDVMNSWFPLLFSLVLSTILSYGYISLLQKYPKTTIGLQLGLFFVSITALGLILFNDYVNHAQETPVPFNSKLSLAFAILVWTLELILFCCALCLCSKIKIMIDKLENSTKFVQDYSRAKALPFLMTIIFVFYFCYWCIASSFIASVGSVAQVDGKPYGTLVWTLSTR